MLTGRDEFIVADTAFVATKCHQHLKLVITNLNATGIVEVTIGIEIPYFDYLDVYKTL